MKIIDAMNTKYVIVNDSSMEAAITSVVTDYRESVYNSFLLDENLKTYLKKKMMIEAKPELISRLVTEFKIAMKKPVDTEFYKPLLDKIRDSDNVMMIPESILFYREVEAIIREFV